jgi:hypothetical protein
MPVSAPPRRPRAPGRVADAHIADSSVALGGLAHFPEEAKQMAGRGYQFILLGFDVEILSAHLGSMLGEITGDPQ